MLIRYHLDRQTAQFDGDSLPFASEGDDDGRTTGFDGRFRTSPNECFAAINQELFRLAEPRRTAGGEDNRANFHTGATTTSPDG
jgi:hypothetical protein